MFKLSFSFWMFLNALKNLSDSFHFNSLFLINSVSCMLSISSRTKCNFPTFSGRDDATREKLGDFLYVYEIFVVIWIIFGLGYVFMIIGELMEGLRSPARKAAKKLRKARKVILERVLHEVVLIKSRVSTNFNEFVQGDKKLHADKRAL